MKQIDPTERALDAYFLLDTDQRRTFHATIVHVERERDRILGRAADIVPKIERRGRPAGSKNRKLSTVNATDPQTIELIEKLFGNNGAVEDGL